MKFDEVSNKVIGCAIEVHRALGPGLLESALSHTGEIHSVTGLRDEGVVRPLTRMKS